MSEKPAENRREFLKKSSAVAGAVAAANLASLSSGAYASGTDTLKIGLVGCGGRGSGAATGAPAGDPNPELVSGAGAVQKNNGDSGGGGKKPGGGRGERGKVQKKNTFVRLCACQHAMD